MYTGSQIFRRTPPTVSNAKKIVRNGLLTWWIGKIPNWRSKGTKSAKNQIGISTVANFQPLLNDQSVNLVPKTSADEKERFDPILILVHVKLPKNKSTAYQESTFSVTANNMSNFQTKMKSKLLDRHTLMHQNRDFMHKHVFNN